VLKYICRLGFECGKMLKEKWKVTTLLLLRKSVVKCQGF
jgi:hypothetical protein